VLRIFDTWREERGVEKKEERGVGEKAERGVGVREREEEVV
jgi:hypothetical protein